MRALGTCPDGDRCRHRTQIGSIRAKAGAGSISELVRQVAVLPPLVGALRGS
jgi:hypothetical protein